MLQFLSNAFNDPSDPWYYVIGVLFLLAVFGAIAAYVIISGKKKGQDGDEKENPDSSKAEQQGKDEATENTDAGTKPQQDKE